MKHPTHPRNNAALTLRLLGSFQLQLHGTPPPPLRTRKEGWLLALLTLAHGKPVERTCLAQTLWPFPETSQSQAAANLRRSLWVLREALGAEADCLLCPSLRTLALDLSKVEADVLAFDAAIAQADLSSLEQAVALYAGPLLADCTEPWALEERERRQQAYQQALERLAAAALSAGDREGAVRHLRQAVATDPLRESTQRRLMEVLQESAELHAALGVYREFVRLLQQADPRAVPHPQTSALYQQIRQQAHRVSQPQVRVAPCGLPPGSAVGNLRHPLTELVGRETEMAEVQARLKQSRLVTLVGAGGVGKTRLALAVAEASEAQFPHGVWFVELGSLSDAGLVQGAVAAVLEVREEKGRPLLQTLAEHLTSRSLLLVLDNCEHLLAACAALAAALLGSCAGLRILATSRQRLGITGEVLYRVPPLSTPDPQQLLAEGEHLLSAVRGHAAVQLFIERAEAVTKQFALTAHNARLVAQICRRLDGIPLAIEMAAARVQSLSVEQIGVRLKDRFGLLRGGSRTALAHQQTLLATLDWSYGLLSEPERRLLGRLSVFVGGWYLEAAEAVCVGEEPEAGAVLDLLSSLVEKSLVVYAEQEGAGRYRLLETVRQYARDRLQVAGDAALYRSRHRDHYLSVAEAVRPKLSGPEQAATLSLLEQEHDNLRAALDWCAEEAQSAQVGLRLAGALQGFWWTRGHLSEGRQRCAQALGHSDAAVPTRARADVLNGAGVLASLQGEYEVARSCYQESLVIYRALEDRRGIADSLNNLGLVAYRQGDYETACTCYQESLSLRRALGDRQGLASCLNNLGSMAYRQGNNETARSCHQESLALCRELGDRHGIATSLNNLGLVAYFQSDFETARTCHQESLALCRELEDRHGIASCLNNLGLVAAEQGDFETARTCYQESLALCRELGDRQGIASALESCAYLAKAQQHPQLAILLYVAAATLYQSLGAPLSPTDRQEMDRHLTELRATLGDADFEAAWAASQAMPLEQAIAYALAETEQT